MDEAAKSHANPGRIGPQAGATSTDTIAAIATGAAWSHRAILRLSGPATHQLLNTWFTPHDADAPHRNLARRCETGRILLDHDNNNNNKDNNRPGGAQQSLPLSLHLPCIVMRFAGPWSFTGEDSAELLFVGSPHVARRVLDRALSWPGVRQAEPGEFSARAYLNGRLTLSQAEGVAATIAAETAEQLSAAERVLSGRAGASYRSAADELASLLALVEAGIDFTDQDDVVPIDAQTLADRLRGVRTLLVDEAGELSSAEALSGEVHVVLAGSPNAGKSTLFNALLGRRRSLVSEQPGTTRDVLREPLDMANELRVFGVVDNDHEQDTPTNPASPSDRRVMLTDLAGLDASLGASSSIDASAQSLARAALSQADVIVWCDPTGRFDPALFAAVALPTSARLIRVRTKADLATLIERADPSASTTSTQNTGGQRLSVCAIDGWNLGPLRRAIADAAFGSKLPACTDNDDANIKAKAAAKSATSTPSPSTSSSVTASAISAVLPRHRRSATHAIREIDAALALLDETSGHALRETPELVASALRASLDSVGELVGQISPDDVIGRVFATFCVGK